jgi:outer membrane protein OmpA-like peptidoglycan-associated protein
MRLPVFITLGLFACAAVASPVEAQRFPGLGGVEGRVGAAFPDDASSGVTTAVDVDLGYLFMPYVRTVAGFDYFRANISERAFGQAGMASGSLTAPGGRLGLRLDLFGMGAVRPYGIAAITAHSVSVDADTPAEQELIDREFGGFVVGASLGVGAGYALDNAQRIMATGEFRRVWNANIPHYAAELGVRIMLRGAGAYDRVVADPWGARSEAERARAERERLGAEQARLTAEDARRAEEARLAEARRAEEARTEQERRARMTDEERRRAQAEADEARARAEREAAARARAEADAAVARQEAEAARAETDAAQRRAREAEEQLYRSLLDLDRLMTNVTAIRETERGLSVVLGQGLFAVGQSALSPRAQDEVGRIAAVLTQFGEHRISVEGHTDSTGSLELNQRLSEQRASSVRAALVAHGIDPARVSMVGHGPNLPIADNTTAAGRAQNRRVEIVILGARRPGT